MITENKAVCCICGKEGKISVTFTELFKDRIMPLTRLINGLYCCVSHSKDEKHKACEVKQ